ncbi:MAG: hypothetical protein HYR85_22065 [Planctomycetes bacterium]|nr:hypothetical protein [Planctomycetota bacterium]MBI3846535.1 hypothetical protein [Planctomycetota bacterium]
MRTTVGLASCTVLALLGAIAQPAHAQLKYDQPGSLLIFPFVQGDARRDTFLTVTNTNIDCTSCGNGFRQGDIGFTINFIDPSDCSEVNSSFLLSPGDTITLSVSQQNLGFPEGWAWLDARDPETDGAVQFDYLVGSVMLFDSRSGQTWEYNAYPFQAFPESMHRLGPAAKCGGPGVAGYDNCGRPFTDVDGEGDADFDGCEYGFWPDEILLDNFFEESGNFDNELALITPDPFGSSNTHRIDFGFWNNTEVRFSRSMDLFCFFHGRLSDISLIVRGLRGTTETVDINGTTYQTGWMEVNSRYPLLGVFMQKKSGTRFAAGRELQFRGLQGDEAGEFAASLQR